MVQSTKQQKLEQLVALFDRSPVQNALGTRLHFDVDGDAVVEFPINPAFDNALGATHGGIVSTLLDTAGWFAAATAYETWIATVDLHVQLLAPADGQSLTTVGHLIRAGSKLAMTRMTVHRADGTEVALGQGTFSVTSVPRG